MFKIHLDGSVIGSSKLEFGDPPMGVALGTFFPAAKFEVFKATIPPEKNDDPAMKRWTRLSVSASDGQPVQCRDVVLLEIDLGGEFAYEINIFGIDGHDYQRLFPDHVQAYENQYK